MTPTIAPEPTDPIDVSCGAFMQVTEQVDTASLLALAKAATPGPWGYVEAPMFNGVLAARRDVATTGPRSDPRSKADGLFIAAANPQIVTRLCEEVARLRAFVEGVRGLRDGLRRSVAGGVGRVHHETAKRLADDLTALLATLDDKGGSDA